MTKSQIDIGIVHYPGALLSAVQGLAEQFYLANTICNQHGLGDVFKTHMCDGSLLDTVAEAEINPLRVIILPPCLDDSYYLDPQAGLLRWLKQQHQNGAIICSVCAGAFVLAETGLLNGRRVTTHWVLADEFSKRFPDVELDSNKLLINDMDIVTAGGLMSWIDLGLELVAQFTNSQIMRQLGKFLIVDTSPREQRYYQTFTPKLGHGDDAIVKAQHALQRDFNKTVVIKNLAELSHLTERTFLRRFVKATGFKPTHYLQHLRVQKACELIESNTGSFEKIATEVGYEDISAFRKTFVKITGQTPKEFKRRFV
ncbi:GlxA family transcriptional regulator [Neptuniibacter sp.]|uniref:GlxA family transcriptional regulator n=1 Tax=Neptuniibacter sp. TaxID=1962643 RepID=UPI0026171106|nr:helix-turn-helix domain-containing protein [Neptuniibacter sp.]MCP4596122.1 helix-turn-helix domain-containing protein [Neptuniibacter sp.]